jgi:hypothetical protein
LKKRSAEKVVCNEVIYRFVAGESSIKYALAAGEPRQFWDLEITERYAMPQESGVVRAELQSGLGWYYTRRFDELPKSGWPGSVVCVPLGVSRCLCACVLFCTW